MICVDTLSPCPPIAPAGRWKHSHFCHMTSDNLPELHAFALRIGLKRSYFQDMPDHPHYDLTTNKRRLAVANGAKQLTCREFFEFCRQHHWSEARKARWNDLASGKFRRS